MCVHFYVCIYLYVCFFIDLYNYGYMLSFSTMANCGLTGMHFLLTGGYHSTLPLIQLLCLGSLIAWNAMSSHLHHWSVVVELELCMYMYVSIAIFYAGIAVTIMVH